MWISASELISEATTVDLPLRGPPATATCPAPAARSTHSGSRRCSNGRSTMPSTAGNEAGSPRHGSAWPSNWSSAGGSLSGGSQIRCAAGPGPDRSSTVASSNVWLAFPRPLASRPTAAATKPISPAGHISIINIFNKLTSSRRLLVPRGHIPGPEPDDPRL